MIYLDAPVDRRVLFIVDEKGGSGKTTWAKWIT